jgi:branched-chain amino acid transport system permease protein
VFYVQLIIAGVATGFIYALAGMGVVLTYKATGVFNFGHGAVAVLVAYVFYQLAEWGVPVYLAAALAILVLAPLLGLLLEWLVFRPLQRSGASTVEKLVATLGVFVLFLGFVFLVWTGRVRQAPQLFRPTALRITDDLIVPSDNLVLPVVVSVVCLLLWLLFTRTHLGTEIRAVVDRRELAQLAAIDADRVAAIAWALSMAMAGLAGVLYASVVTKQLIPYELSLFMIETFSLAVVARLTSLPVAVATGVLLLGVGDSLLKSVDLFGGEGLAADAFNELKPNLSVILLFAALLIYRRLDVVGEEGTRRLPFVRTNTIVRPHIAVVAVGTLLLALPIGLDRVSFDYAHRMLAFVVIFTSIVVVTGFSGHITLGQAAFAGLGAFASARLANAAGLPVLLAMIGGGLLAVVAGLLAGYPALRRRGLFLALTTLALGLLISRFVLENTAFAGGTVGLQVERPNLFGLSLSGNTAFYYFEVAVVGIMLLVARNVRSGRLGRALAAMRDSEAGAKSVGIDLRAYKLFIFGISAFMAGIGGALYTQGALQFSATNQFSVFNSLFWFAAVVVAGIGSISGAVLGAFVFVMLDVVLKTSGSSQFIIGLAALGLGRLPGASLLGLAAAMKIRAETSLRRVYDSERARRAAPPPEPVVLRPTPLALELLGAGTPAAGSGGNGRRRAPLSARRAP